MLNLLTVGSDLSFTTILGWSLVAWAVISALVALCDKQFGNSTQQRPLLVIFSIGSAGVPVTAADFWLVFNKTLFQLKDQEAMLGFWELTLQLPALSSLFMAVVTCIIVALSSSLLSDEQAEDVRMSGHLESDKLPFWICLIANATAATALFAGAWLPPSLEWLTKWILWLGSIPVATIALLVLSMMWSAVRAACRTLIRTKNWLSGA